MAGHDHTVADTDAPQAGVIEDPQTENHEDHEHDTSE
jgi:hypothetical protein